MARCHSVKIIALLFFMQFAVFPLNVHAETTVPQVGESASDGVENLFMFANDFVIHGVTNKHDYYFEVTRSRKIIDGSYIELFFGHSPTLLPKKSTITLMIDDIPLGSEFLNETNLQRTSWKFPITNLVLKTGFHKISIVTHMEASGNICEDQNNTANWIILHKESVIHLNLEKNYAKGDLSWYPSPFLEEGSLNPLQTLFVLPEHTTETQLFVLASLSRFFSGKVASAMLQYKVVKETELTESMLRENNLIWIGEPAAWSNYAAKIMAAVEKQRDYSKDKGHIYSGASPWNLQKSILMINGNENQLKEAAYMLTNDNLVGQLGGNFVSIAGNTISDQLEPDLYHERSNKVTLQDLGYPDLVIESILVGGARIQFNIPAEWDIHRGGQLKLNFRHSKTLNFAQSLVSVKVNDIPAASRYLSEETTDFGTLTVDIPKQLLSGKSVIVDIAFQFSSSKESCTGNSQIGNWAVVSKDSFFSFSYRPNQTLDIQNLPYPFVINGKWNQAAFVLPRQSGSEELSLFASITGAVGKNVDALSNPNIYLAHGEELQQELLNKNIIFIGLSSKVPSFLLGGSSIPIDIQKNIFVPAQEEIDLIDSLKRQASLMELYDINPNNGKAHSVLLITGTNNSDLARINRLYNQPAKRGEFQGKALLIDPLNRIHAYQAAVQPDEPMFMEKVQDFFNPGKKSILDRSLFIFLFVGVIIIFALILWIIRKRIK